MITDNYKREINYLRISVTDRCNLKCLYCAPDKKPDYFQSSEILTNSEILRFVGIVQKFGLSKVRLTGGEPLLRDDIVELVAGIKAIGIRDVSLTTNGIRLASMASALKQAGLSRVNISLDTLRADRYKEIAGCGDINDVWTAVKSAIDVGLYPVKLNVVPIRDLNDDEIEDFARLTLDNDFHVRFIELMPVGRGKGWKHQRCIRKDELIERVSRVGRLELFEFKGKGPSRNYRIEGAKGVIGFISPVSDCFCDYCNRLRLSATGKLRPCLFSDEEIDIKRSLRDGSPDEVIEELFVRAVTAKPEGHRLKEGKTPDLSSMSKIGG